MGPRGDEAFDVCLPGPNFASSETLSYTIPGLTNGTGYSFTVKATSTSPDYADSAVSAAAGATPQAPRLPVPGNVRLSGHRYADRNDPGKCFPCIDVSWNPVAGAVLSGIPGTAIYAIKVTALSTGNDFRDSPASGERSITYSG